MVDNDKSVKLSYLSFQSVTMSANCCKQSWGSASSTTCNDGTELTASILWRKKQKDGEVENLNTVTEKVSLFLAGIRIPL